MVSIVDDLDFAWDSSFVEDRPCELFRKRLALMLLPTLQLGFK